MKAELFLRTVLFQPLSLIRIINQPDIFHGLGAGKAENLMTVEGSNHLLGTNTVS